MKWKHPVLTGNERIVFMGTPEFAVATLDALVSAGFPVCAVVTAPDRPAGRGRQLRASAVKQRALELGIDLLQPEKLKDPVFVEQLKAYNASIHVVVAFRMLPEAIWNMPPLGTINLHASLLPKYRGAAPINWAVANGEEVTGATTFRIQQEIDTGDVLLQEKIDIGKDDTAGDVHDRLMVMGAALMVRTIHGLFDGTLHATPQQNDKSDLPAAPKLNNENTRLHFDRLAQQVHDLVRGMSPFPGAWCEWMTDGNRPLHCKVLRTRIADMDEKKAPGTVLLNGTRMFVACDDGFIEVMELQLEGRKRMESADLFRGLRVEGTISLQ